MTNVRLLAGLKVVDLGVGMAAAIAAKFLSDSGADVIRVEPEEGDPFAAFYPAYEIWHRGASKADVGQLDALLVNADICIVGGEDHPDIVRRRDSYDIASRHPKLVVLDLTDGPEGTDYCGPTTELLAQARSGIVWEQVSERPIVNAFEPGSYGAALQGIIGVLGALFEREASGQGQVVSTSLFEGTLPWLGIYWSQLEAATPMADFVIPVGVSPLIFRAKDGVFIHMAIGGAGSKYGFYQALEIDDPLVLPTDSGMPKPGGSPRDFFGDYELLAAHVAKKDSGELLDRIWERGLPAEPVRLPGECWNEEQIALNGIIVKDADGTRHIGMPFASRPLAKGAVKRASIGSKPLTGIKVVDCGAFVAGPVAAVILADLGADVIKIEAKQGDPNRSIFKSFSVANRSKKVIGVDMKAADGLAAVHALCKDADVVMNNFRPGVSSRLGIDPQSLSGINPSLVVLEAPAYGSEGPLAMKAGFDMVMQAWTGHEAKAAGQGNEPRWNRTSLVDIAASMLGAISVLSALLHRERTGEAVALDSPLCNAGIFTLSELIQRADGKFEGVPTLSSTLSGYHPAECLYEAKDGWVALVARGNVATAGLARGLGLSAELPSDIATWNETHEAAIAAKAAALTIDELTAAVAPHGIWIEPCKKGMQQQILNDPALIARGTIRTSQHPTFAQVNELGAMYHYSRSTTGNDLPAPMPGEHSREILTKLGYDAAQIDDLYSRGVVV